MMATENVPQDPAPKLPARVSPLHRIAHVLVLAGSAASTVGTKLLQGQNEDLIIDLERAHDEIRRLRASVSFHRERADRAMDAAAEGGTAYLAQAPDVDTQVSGAPPQVAAVDGDEHQAPAGNP